MRDVAQFFKVLSDEARLQILWLLFNHKELCVCDIVEALGITQSKASRHLATLRHAELVSDRKDGAWSYYSVRTPESDLKRGQLEFLRTELAGYAGATKVLEVLHSWLERKERESACLPSGACGPSKRPAVAVSARRAAGGRT